MPDGPHTPIEQPAKQTSLSTVGKIWTHGLRVVSLILGISALGLCVWFFAGFAANDVYILHLLSAAFLCFGIGAPAYIPVFMIARTAHVALQSPPKRRPRVIAVCLVLPWLPLSWYLFLLGGKWVFGAGVMVFYIIITIIWAIVTMRTER